MERRDFMGSLLAIFCGVAMPERVIEQIQVAPSFGMLGDPKIFAESIVTTEELMRAFAVPAEFLKPPESAGYHDMRVYGGPEKGTWMPLERIAPACPYDGLWFKVGSTTLKI